MPWTDLIPQVRGQFPWPQGGEFHRTNPGGNPGALIAILGVYPTATSLIQWVNNNGAVRNLVRTVEATSFEPASRSGEEIDRVYLNPQYLNLTRDHVWMFDMMPYAFANTRIGQNGRCMADNIEEYQEHAGNDPLIERRPLPNELLLRCRTMNGNLDRLKEYLYGAPATDTASARILLITLGNEPAAFVRGYTNAQQGQQHLYPEHAQLVNFLGGSINIVSLAHPGQIMVPRSPWLEPHRLWCQESWPQIRAELGLIP